MHCTVYSTVSSEGFSIHQDGKILSFLFETDKLIELLNSHQAVVVDYPIFEAMLERDMISTSKSKWIIVITDKPHTREYGEKVWFTCLDLKQVRRELKIQGFQNVLMLGSRSLIDGAFENKMVNTFATTVLRTISDARELCVTNYNTLTTKLDILSDELIGEANFITYKVR
jgi:dihydrofolate reductase